MLDKRSVLHIRNSFLFSTGMKIFYLEEKQSDGNTLMSYLSKLIEFTLHGNQGVVGTLPYRLGILYESAEGHVTPLLFEFFMQVDAKDTTIITVPPRFRIYSTDSRAFDVEGGEVLRQTILNLPNLHDSVEVYALGLDPDKDLEKKNTIRQHSDGVCGLYSLLDLELMLRAPSLSDFFGPHVVRLTDKPYLPISNPRTFQITRLPPSMMLYTQSIYGNDVDERKGLRHYLQDNPDKAKVCFTLANKSMSFAEMISIKGYESIISGLSQPQSPLHIIGHAVASGQGNATLHVGDKKITLQALYNWHVNQEKNNGKQKSFMMDFFVATFNEMMNRSYSPDCDDLKKDDATLLLNLEAFREFVADGYEFGPMTELIDDLPKKNEIVNLIDFTDNGTEQLFDSIVTQFAREVIARTPHRERLLDQDHESVLGPTPISKSVSPDQRQATTPPVALNTKKGGGAFVVGGPIGFFGSSPTSIMSFRLSEDSDSRALVAESKSLPRPTAKRRLAASRRLDFFQYGSSELDSDTGSEPENAQDRHRSGSDSPDPSIPRQ